MPMQNLRVVVAQLEFRVGFTDSNAEAVNKVEEQLKDVPGKIKVITVTTNG